MRRVCRRAVALAFALGACASATSPAPDAGAPDGGLADAGHDDAGAAEAGIDGGPVDAGAALVDAADLDAAPDDAAAEGSLDADLDADVLDADLDAGPDFDGSVVALDAAAALDAGPTEASILRTYDPPTHPDRPPLWPATECTVTTATDAFPFADHRAPCSAIDYPFLPPAGGPHFSQWAAFRTYDAPVPWGFLVHALEHGAVVLAYRCGAPADCDAIRAEFASLVTDRGVDPTCRLEATPQRIIVVPDPTLPTPIAAVAWGHAYGATCLDPPSLRAFVDSHYAMATEDFCAPGVDLSATGWCSPPATP